MVGAYAVSSLPKLLHTEGFTNWLLRDAEDVRHHQELMAHVKSGDYLSLLATRLDEISQHLDTDKQQAAVISLQQIVDDLLFLQHHCDIVRK